MLDSLFAMKPSLALLALVAAFLSLNALTSSAQTVSKKEMLAGELLDELNVQKLFDSVFDSVPKMQGQMMAADKMSPEEQAQFQKQMQQSMQATKKAMNWDSLKPIFVKIYADNLDEADLEGMVAFYKSPLGQKWVQKQPQIQAATMQAMSGLMPKIQAAIMQSVTQPSK